MCRFHLKYFIGNPVQRFIKLKKARVKTLAFLSFCLFALKLFDKSELEKPVKLEVATHHSCHDQQSHR